MQQGLGAPVRWLDRAEVAALMPGLRIDDLLGATYCPADGWARPPLVATAFARRAEALGARSSRVSPVTGITVAGGAVAEVRTLRGAIETPIVVDAAGPWASEVAALAGIALPAEPVCRQVFRTAPFADVDPRAPLTIDVTSNLWFRPHEGGFWWGKSDEDEPPGLTKHLDPDWARHTADLALDRMPPFAGARDRRRLVGLLHDDARRTWPDRRLPAVTRILLRDWLQRPWLPAQPGNRHAADRDHPRWSRYHARHPRPAPDPLRGGEPIVERYVV